MKTLAELKPNFKYWESIKDMIDQHIDVMLNLSQSGHPGGSRSKVYALVSTLLSGAMSWDIRNPGKRFGDRFILSAGHANPVVYATLAVFNEALRRKYQQTGNDKYLNPLGQKFTLTWEDVLTLRRRGGLPGHAEMEGKTLFFKSNTGPSGHGFPIAAGQAFALKYAGMNQVKVFTIEGEGGLTPGVIHETKNSAYGLGLGNFITLVDWNDFGIDGRPFSDVVAGTPRDWFEPYGWAVEGVEDGENWGELMEAYCRLMDNDNPHQLKMIYMKMRKGRGYGKFDAPSHGAPHKRNSSEFWETKSDYSNKYGIEIPHIGDTSEVDYETNKGQMADVLQSVLSLFDKQEGLLDYLADRLIELGDNVESEDENKFKENPLNDPVLFDYKNYPFYKKSGEIAPNRAGFGDFGSWINSYTQEKYGRPLFLVNSADLAGSTNIAGFSKGYGNVPDSGMYHRDNNPKGSLMPQGITEFANAGINVGISSVNFSEDGFDDFNGFYTASSTYGSFSYLKYGAYRLFSQVAQDSQLKVGKTIWVAGHSGPETAEDSRTHFGIFSPGVTQLFPKGHVLNLHPYEYNEVPAMLGAALATDIPIIALHLTRPGVEIPNREALGMASHFDAAKGAYIIRNYDNNRPHEGVVLVRGTKVIDELLTLLSQFGEDGPNVKIVAVLSYGLFEMQSKEYQISVISDTEWVDAMIITNTSIANMSNWTKYLIVKEYSVSADWDNRWRSGGTLDDVIDEAHLSAEWQWKAITRFANERKERLEKVKSVFNIS